MPADPTAGPASDIPERGWTKLCVFSATLQTEHALRGTALFLDLDVVIVGDITALFEHPGEFLIIHDWKRRWRITGNSSVFRFEFGAHADALERFRTEHESIRARLRNEQAWLSEVLHAQGRLTYWPDAWCVSWKYHCIARWPLNLLRVPSAPPGARVLVFHGVINPPDALAGRSTHAWRRALPSPWLAEHWRE